MQVYNRLSDIDTLLAALIQRFKDNVNLRAPSSIVEMNELQRRIEKSAHLVKAQEDLMDARGKYDIARARVNAAITLDDKAIESIEQKKLEQAAGLLDRVVSKIAVYLNEPRA